MKEIYTSYSTLSSGKPWNITRVTCISRWLSASVYSMVYQESVLHNYLIPYSGQQNQWDNLFSLCPQISQRISPSYVALLTTTTTAAAAAAAATTIGARWEGWV